MRLLMLSMFAVLVIPGTVLGQNYTYDGLITESAEVGPPDTALSDDIGVLDDNPELREKLEQMLRDLESDFGFRIYVLVRPVWMGGTVHDLAAILQQSWFPTGEGLVLVVETDNRKLGLGVAMENRPGEDTWLIPTHVSSGLLKRVADRADYEAPIDDFLEGLVTDVVNEHRLYFEKRNQSTSLSERLKDSIPILGLGFLLLVAVAATLAWRHSLHKKQLHRMYRFPAANQPERLGAPFGGGKVAVCKFDQERP